MNPKDFEVVECEHIPLHCNCRLCGVYLCNGSAAYKTIRYMSTHEDTNARYINSLKRQAAKQQCLKEKCDYSEMVFELLTKLTDKFQFGLETLALGIYLFNLLLQKPDGSYRKDSTELISSTCLIVAAKAIELDKHIPYFSRYQKHASKNHTKQEFEMAEKQIMEEFQFCLQRPTFVTFINFYLSNGIVFSDEDFCFKKVCLLEEKVKQRCYKILKQGTFVLEEPNKLAANIINDCRRQFRLTWHPAIQEYSGVKPDQLHTCDNILKPLLNMHRHTNTSVVQQHIKLTLPRLDMKDKSSSRPKDKVHYLRGAQSLRSIPSFNSLQIFGFKRSQM